MKDFKYPYTRKDDFVEDYHGKKIPDPYRWLEDVSSKDTQKWIKQQNKITFNFIRRNSDVEIIGERLRDLWNYARFSTPEKRQNRYFYFKNDGLQNHEVFFLQEGLTGQPRMVLDPNTWSKDGTSALENLSISEDGRLVAFGRGEAGSDWQKIHILSVDDNRLYPEVLDWCRFSAITWKHDSSGFFYNRFPEKGSVAPEDRINYSRVCWHSLGSSQSDDLLIYEDRVNKELLFYPLVTYDGHYLILHVFHGTDPRNLIFLRPVDSAADFQKLIGEKEASFQYICNQGKVFYFLTDHDAPRYRVIAIDIEKPDRKNWREVIPQSAVKIEQCQMVNGQLVVVEQKDVANHIKLYTLDGKFIKEIDLPGPGSVAGILAHPQDTEFFFLFTSFLYPTSIFRYDFGSTRVSVFKKAEFDFEPDKFESKQVFFSSRDGTRIPMFITHRKGLSLNGDNPVLLYGYGGFNIDQKPQFSTANILWMEQGGIYAVANLRGGSEYGEEWHKAGMLEKKQNVFDDFIAAAEWLIDAKYTSPIRLAIIGGSNGGLLVGACLVQRPDLYGAAVCRVPVLDMLRFHKFTVGRYWVPEYGDPDNPEHFKFIYAYSPLHNVKRNAYPAVLLMTADTDDRVAPAHAFKFTAVMQEMNYGENPVLIRVEQKAGHGHGKPIQKIIDETADIYAFLFKIFNLSYAK